jgi:periplasmic protein TonB
MQFLRFGGNEQSYLTEEDATMENKKSFKSKFFPKRDTQASLFHYIKEKPDPGVFEDMDWSFLTHPIQTIKEGWNTPCTKASLFNYLGDGRQAHLSFKELLSEVFTFRNPLFIPSVFSDPGTLAMERSQFRIRRMEAGVISIILYGLVGTVLAVAVAIPKHKDIEDVKEAVVINTDMPTPPPIKENRISEDRDGGGGGGGGRNDPRPPSPGGLPAITLRQLVPPELGFIKPVAPADVSFSFVPSIEGPVEMAYDPRISVGDITVPPGPPTTSYGPGSGGGIGRGRGSGIGEGTGSGAGWGEGSGDGRGRGTGNGDKVGPYVSGAGMEAPEPLFKPNPNYTEDARKARIEGSVLLEVIIRANGTVDSFRVVRGLGHGLDESAINTVSSKWRFKPATKNKVPYDVKANIEVIFRLL